MKRWRNLKKEYKKQSYQKQTSKLADVEYAGFWIRLLAVMMDTFMIITPITIVIGIIFGYDALKSPDNNNIAGIIQMVFYAIITIGMWQKWGQTPGKKALKLYIVDAKTLKKPTLMQYTLHFIGYFIAMVSLIGFLIGIFRKDKRALHDLISSTAVIIKEEGIN